MESKVQCAADRAADRTVAACSWSGRPGPEQTRDQQESGPFLQSETHRRPFLTQAFRQHSGPVTNQPTTPSKSSQNQLNWNWNWN